MHISDIFVILVVVMILGLKIALFYLSKQKN